MKRRLSAIVLGLCLLSCGRQVALHVAPLALIEGLASIEVRVWNAADCPPFALAASPDTLGDVALVRFYQGTDTTPVGATPSGSHAVSVLARSMDCTTQLFGCTPSVNFERVQEVTVIWSRVAVTDQVQCPMGYACDTNSGSCFQPRAGGDAGP